MPRIGQCFNTCLLTGVDIIPVNVYVTISVGPRLLVPEPQSVTWNQNISKKVVNTMLIIAFLHRALKCHCYQIFDIHFFYIFEHPGYLAKFQSVTKDEAYVFLALISENLVPPLIFFVPILG